jgi:branched-chain amino acid aminotransferase
MIKIFSPLPSATKPSRITRDEVYCADEAFFTGTAAEVTPIRELDNRTIGAGTRRPITEQLQALYFDCV